MLSCCQGREGQGVLSHTLTYGKKIPSFPHAAVGQVGSEGNCLTYSFSAAERL